MTCLKAHALIFVFTRKQKSLHTRNKTSYTFGEVTSYFFWCEARAQTIIRVVCNETVINKNLAYVLGPYKSSPNRNIGAAHTRSKGSTLFHTTWATRVVFTLHTRAPSSPSNLASCHTSFLGTCREGTEAVFQEDSLRCSTCHTACPSSQDYKLSIHLRTFALEISHLRLMSILV